VTVLDQTGYQASPQEPGTSENGDG
jgi:hypothetical protein